MLILLALVVLVVVLVVRTMSLQPTAAKDTKIQLDTSERSVEYGKKLAKMVQVETISSRFDEDRTKFYKFHDIL